MKLDRVSNTTLQEVMESVNLIILCMQFDRILQSHANVRICISD